MDFPIICADPPWTYQYKGEAGKRGASQQYKTLELHEIARLPVWDLAAKNCFLAMWWTYPLAQEALDLVKFLGFKIKTMGGITWVKTTRTGKYPIGMGYWTRTNAEPMLFATRGKVSRVCASVPALLHAPRGRHSEKPAAAYDRIVSLMGDDSRLELFARDFRPGWWVWGDELPPSIHGAASNTGNIYFRRKGSELLRTSISGNYPLELAP